MDEDGDLRAAIAAFQRDDVATARKLAEGQLAAEPSPQLHHLLGLIECRAGRPETGVEWLRRALEADPRNVPFRVMLARALADAGRPAEALEVADVPAATGPGGLALWHTRAEAADAAEAWEVAAQAWDQLAQARPTDWRASANRGNALMKLRRWPDAAAAFEHASKLNPAEPILRRSLATALGRAGDHDRSVAEMERVVERPLAALGDRLTLARLLADLGRAAESARHLDLAAQSVGAARFDESSELLSTLVGAGDHVAARELAQLLERTNRTEALNRLLDVAERAGIARTELAYPAAAAALRAGRANEAEQLLAAEPADSDPVRWHGLMARIAEKLDDPARAFAEAEAMHRSVHDHAGWRARADRHIAAVKSLAGAITPDWARKLSALQPDDRRSPVFLVGFPRSGTTLLDTFLMGHEAVTVLEEVALLDEARRSIGDLAELPRRTPSELRRARDAYFAALDEHVGSGFDGLVIDKLPLNLLAAPLIHVLFPEARIIFAQRHPCDSLLSCFMQAFALNDSMACFLDLRTSADFYDAAMTLWLRSADALPLNSRTLVYEELVADPEAALRPLVAFLGIAWQDRLLDHRATAATRDAINTPSYSQVTQPLTRSASGRWRRYRAEIEPVLSILLPWAERLGYQP